MNRVTLLACRNFRLFGQSVSDLGGSIMSYERYFSKEHQPTDKEVLESIGNTEPWLDLREYLEENYDFEPQIVFYGKKYGWTIRYRRSGKTLCSLFPEKGAFTALVVLGKKEVERVLSSIDEYSDGVLGVIENTEHLHDGRWLWIRVLTMEDTADIKKLLAAKRKPKRGNR